MNPSSFCEKPAGGTELQLAAWRAYVPAALQASIHLTVSALPAPKRPLKPHVFWAHQAPDQPSVQNLADPLVQRGIDGFVFVSQWQREQYINQFGISPGRTYVVHNAIEPIAPHQKPSGPLRLIYTSTPFRGLDVLLEAWAQLPALDIETELHIYSGMALYGRPAEDAHYQALYDRAGALPRVHYHGVASNQAVRQALQASHIFAYPCTWEETSCLSLIEALSAGCLAVVPDLAALPETAAGFANLYPYTPDKDIHVARFKTELLTAINQYRTRPNQTAARLATQVAHFNQAYSWETRRHTWVQLLEQIIHQYERQI